MSKKYRIILLVSIALIVLTMGSVVMAQGRRGSDPGNPPFGSGNQNQAAIQNQANMRNQAMDCSQAGTMNRAGGRMNRANRNARGTCLFTDAPVDIELSEAEIDAMVAGLSDEYHAYDVYAAVIEELGNVRPFTHIMNAEAHHIAAWEGIFARYGVDLPERPTVDVPDFDTLADACAFAADAEIANASLYDEMLATLADYPDMVRVITNLRDASFDNHLPAFEQCSE